MYFSLDLYWFTLLWIQIIGYHIKIIRQKKKKNGENFFVCESGALIVFLWGNLDEASAKQIRYKLKVRAKGSPQQGSIEWQALGPPMHGL